MKCFYHSDLDGQCAAYWVRKYTNNNNKEDYIKINYNDEFPFDIISQEEVVYIVDFSIFPEDMKYLIAITDNIIWIDHHISAINKYKNFEYIIDGIRRDGIAGCELTYLYLFENIDYNNFDYNKIKDKIPLFTRVIGDYDVWKFEYSDTRKFKLGIETYDCNPLSDIWDSIEKPINPIYNDIVDRGNVIYEYIKKDNKRYLTSWSFETKFEGYNCLACNKKSNSWLFGEKFKEYDIVIPFVFNGKEFTCSLYTVRDDIDCSKIAEKYNGGGHKKAAGFRCKELPFKIK